MSSTTFSKPLLLSAKVLAYILHPLFIPTYFFAFLMVAYPYEFAGITEWQLKLRLFSVFWLTAFFPAFAVFLLWRLKFSAGILLRTQKERIVPYVITMFFYWWMYYLSRNFTDQPVVLKFFFMGIFLTTVFGLIINNYFKISMHAMGAGGLVTAIILSSFFYEAANGVAIVVALISSGLICTARLITNDHDTKEIYLGLIVSMCSQMGAYFFIM
jgi:hypothetical protein